MLRKLLSQFRGPSPKQPEALIALLLDEAAEYGDRDDAAGYLGMYDEPAAEEALLQIVLSHTVDEDLADTAGESLREIWGRKKKRDDELIARMNPAARKFFEK